MLLGTELLTFLQIVLIDVSMAGDNVLAVGTAAAGLPTHQRRQAVLAGIGAATVLRILFAIFAVQIMHIAGLLVAGGLILLWVAWKMYRDIRGTKPHKSARPTSSSKTLQAAIIQIVVADVSMSLDNVLAVAGVARDHMAVLAAGLALSVVLMGVAATFVAKLTTRYPWVAYVGLVIVLFTALRMMWDGVHSLLNAH